ncbi:MAG: hypothetical protein HN742_31620 [Lentisphaerae bacterium]|nr:hypothetical protein [Lentisphaerota bacterium]MBT5606462.1 hypothetical protein [Lentisphaerota bacterium]MBT7055676.1 hypothetical protein [Lentisphaerota bacterium]MBT7846461.1 hypothetical protein [Lentisphaerota bacterium]
MEAKTLWRLFGAAFMMLAGSSSAIDRETDFLEFHELAAAETFGWQGLQDARLEIVRDARSGSFALRANAPERAKLYTGVCLRRDVDLTGAGPDDRIVFHIKGNFGNSVCLNMRMNGKHVYRYATTTKDQWTRVELDLDLANWETELKAWGRVTALSFYSRIFDEAGESMVLDGLSVTVNGTALSAALAPAHVIEGWQFPHETTDAWFLGNGDVAWAISKKTGQVVGGWNAAARTRYLNHSQARYHLEDIKGILTGREEDDRVADAVFSAPDQRIVLTCANPVVRELQIQKTYRLEERRLFKETAFAYRGTKTKFVTYNSEVAFTPDYRDGGYYMGAGYVGPLVPAPDLGEWQRVLEYQNTSKGMLLHQPRERFSFAHVRTRLDRQFVWPWFGGAVSSYNEEKNMLHYTPNGWDMSLCTSRLEPGGKVSYEESFGILPDGWYEFLSAHYPSKPDVQEALAEIPPVPEWMDNVKASYDLGRYGIPRLRRLVESTDEGNIIVLIGAWGSLADYYVEEGLVGAHGGFITGPELKDLIQRVQALSPRVKVGIYQWVLSASQGTRILEKHPEWFRRLDKSGGELSTFPGMVANFASLLSIPECYDELLAEFDRVLRYLDVDMIYLDDPKAVNMVDWHSGEYTRDDISYRFFRDLRRLVAKHGPEKMLFFNCRGNPYGDVNFIEARGQLRAGYWRDFVGIGSCIEAFLTCRPAARIVPLYWIPALGREYVNRTLSLGWIPSLTYGDVLGRRPYAQAAYEMGNTSPVSGTYTPDWKRDKDTAVESYLTQRPGDPGYLLSLISHEDAVADIPVTVDLNSLDLSRGNAITIWDHVVADATVFEGRVTERAVKSAYARTGWRLDGVTRRRLLYMGPHQEVLRLNLPMDPLILHQLYITSQRAGVYAVDSMPVNYLFSKTTGVDLKTSERTNPDILQVNVSSKRTSAQIIVYLEKGQAPVKATLNNVRITPGWVDEGGLLCPVFTVGKGQHVLDIECAAIRARATPPQGIEAAVNDNSLSVSIPGLDRAIISIGRQDSVLFSRMVTGQNGTFSIPLAGDRVGGTYGVTVVAGMTADGSWRRGQPLSCGVEIPASSIDLKLSPKLGETVPEEHRTIPINRTVKGIHVLQAATYTSPTSLAGWQPKLEALTASVDADTLTLEAGTTRKIMNFLGAAFAGIEVRDLRKVKIRLTNTYHDAFHLRGPGNHGPVYWPSTRSFAGFVVDYHTPEGYAKRVNLAVGLLDPKCSTSLPKYGKHGPFDELYDLGRVVDQAREKTFSLDLTHYAPDGWDGQVWLSVGSDWAGSDRRLKASILAVNDAVTDGFVTATNPNDSIARYRTPRAVTITRVPGTLIVDGVLDDEMWQGAAKTDEFFLLGGAGVSAARTLAQFYYDEKYLYVGIRCEEPSRPRPIVRHGGIWHDDEVEVFIDANGDGKTFAQVIVNGAGTKAEFRNKSTAVIGTHVAAHVTEGTCWELELMIPYEGMGVEPPKAGDVWRLNVVRQRLPTRQSGHELITWAPLEKGFFELENFAPLRFK